MLRKTKYLVSLLAVAITTALLSVNCLAAPASSAAAEQPNSLYGDFLFEQGALSSALSNLAVTGYARTIDGWFLNSEAIRDNHNKNSIASLRQWLDVDVNDQLTENTKLFMRAWFVYEPPYPSEATLSEGTFQKISYFGQTPLHEPYKAPSDFYNQFGVHEFWIKHTFGPLDLFVGRQIVIWGQSVAFRVGDVVNPADTSYAFGFANLEDSRMPIWMLHPILNLPDFWKLSSNYLETIYAPGFDYMYTQVDYPDDRYDGQNSVAGRVNVLAPSGGPTGFAPNRFGIRNPPPPLYRPYWITAVPGRIFGPPTVQWNIPRATFANSVVGVRLHTLISQNYEATLFYFKSFQYSAIPTVGNPGKPGNPEGSLILFKYFPYQGLGGTISRPVYLPARYFGAFAQVPIVLREEFFYTNHVPFDTLDPAVKKGPVFTDSFNNLLAMDVTAGYVPWLSKTGVLAANLEWNQNTWIDSNKKMLAIALYPAILKHQDESLLMNVGESWWYGAIAPTWTMVYAPAGKTFLLFPSLVLTPPWSPNYFLKLQFIGIFGTNKYAGGGLFKGRNMIVGTFQYNFNVNQLLGQTVAGQS